MEKIHVTQKRLLVVRANNNQSDLSSVELHKNKVIDEYYNGKSTVSNLQ